MLKKLICWGAAGHARVLREFLHVDYEWIALFDNNKEAISPFPDVSVLFGKDGFIQWRRENPSFNTAFVVAIGGSRGRDRLEIQRFLVSRGMNCINPVHPRAFVAATATLGQGSQVLAQAAVCADAKLGEACIVNTSASVDHECVLADGVHIGPGAVLAGCVNVGECSMIGAGAVVLPRVNIGANVIVGAGAVVTKDIPDNQVALGNPARIVRANDV
jgi:sugar O-acyltransferase (sialic acid O-acetyltransferase NeuD family)